MVTHSGIVVLCFALQSLLRSLPPRQSDGEGAPRPQRIQAVPGVSDGQRINHRAMNLHVQSIVMCACVVLALMLTLLRSLTSCARFQCPTKKDKHAPNGAEAECEDCLGCGACQEELTKLVAAKEKDKLVEAKSKEIAHSSGASVQL